jgi:hypothetical protein
MVLSKTSLYLTYNVVAMPRAAYPALRLLLSTQM